MLGAFIKALVAAALCIAIPICIMVLSMLGSFGYKAFLALLLFVLPFVVIGLLYGYFANAE